ncbi:MAG TPA: SpoIIE family protein phosphatase, partial [Candidatus Udaeobacter sp.]|nr:SpoIIE family protein phosphatase [Candidatus Udaeobacter sp.]
LVTLSFAVAAIAILLGVVIVREGPRQLLNWLTAGMLFCGGAGALLGAADFALALRESKLLEAQGGLIRSFAFVWEFFFPVFLLFTLYFPTERRAVRRFPWLGWVILLPYVFHFALLLAGSPTEGRFDLSRLTTSRPALAPLADFLSLALYLIYRLNAALFPLVNLAVTLGASALLLNALQRAQNPRLKMQIRVVLAGLSGCLLFYSLAIPLPVLFGIELKPLARASLIVTGLSLGSLSIAYAIVRHRFLDTQMLARRSILYGAATALLLGLYIALVRKVHVTIAGMVGIDAEYVQTAVLVVALLLFQPVLSRLEDWLESMLIGDRSDYRTVLRNLSRDVTTVLDLGDLGRKVGDMLSQSLLVEGGHLYVRTLPGAEMSVVASFGPVVLPPGLLTDLEPKIAAAPPNDLTLLDELLAGSALLPNARFLVVPLRHRQELLGLLFLGSKVTGRGFNAEDRSLLTTLGDQIGVAIKNSHLHKESIQKTRLEEELTFARNVQQSFLPSRFPPMQPLDLWAQNLPSKFVSGDYYDVVPLGEDEFLIAIGDVSGKGVPAALLMSMLRAALRTQARDRVSLAEMMGVLNRLIHESTSDREFVTLFLARVNRRELRLQYSNGGHNPPLLRRADGSIERLERGGLLLGAFDGVDFEEGAVDLRADDVLVLYTDGLTEALRADGAMFGDERLEAFLSEIQPTDSACELLGRLESTCRDWVEGADLEDDLTLMVLRVDGAAVSNPVPEASLP